MSNPSQTHTMSSGGFRLLIPAARLDAPGSRSILTEQRAPDAGDTPKYTCVSYAWGPGKTANPLIKGSSMSDRAIPAFEAAITAQTAIELQTGAGQPLAIWFDAFCVPARGPSRIACLRSMGAIYAHSSQVIVVLSKSCSVLLEEIRRTDGVRVDDLETLLVFDHDDWLTRAWTYQEIVNSKKLYFVAEGERDAPVDGSDLLRCVGQGIDRYKKVHGYNSYELRTLHPGLNSIEDVIVDWRIANYGERSAYEIMSGMDARKMSEQTEYLFDAMIGALTTTPLDDLVDSSVHPAEYFMMVCEAKGDYSFIYSTAPRSEIPGRCWRPIAGPIQAILPWHSSGGGQSGRVYPTHLELNNMRRMVPGSVDPTAREWVGRAFLGDNAFSSSSDIPALTLRRLRDAGFSGCGEHLELESGYFFPQEALPEMDRLFVVVSTGVRWTFGSPGLLVRGNGTGIHHCCGVGVFVGKVLEGGDVFNIG
jgi:hypothetical protein